MAIVYQNEIAGKICANPDCGWKPVSEFGWATFLGIPRGDGLKSRCKSCSRADQNAKRAANIKAERERARKYVEQNQDHIREIKRAHQQANPEKYDEALRRYRESHRDEINAKAKQRRDANLEHYREIGRKSREKHAEERNSYQRNYGKANRSKLVLFTNRRRARKLEAVGSHTEMEWQSVKSQYEFTCLCCKKREPDIHLTRDHVLPLAKGGSDSIDNIQPLCARCNSKKNNKHIDYRDR